MKVMTGKEAERFLENQYKVDPGAEQREGNYFWGGVIVISIIISFIVFHKN